MTKRDDRLRDALDMRQRAEVLAREAAAREMEPPADLSPEELQEMLHELRVHQIQLELQNEELRRAQEEIGAARARYFDLYDLAPVGYCTLSEDGLILEANLTLATLLGLERGALVKQPVSRFVFKEDQDIYYLHRKQLFETGEPQECELRLLRPDGAPFWAHLKGTAARAEDGAPFCRVAISDITERRRAADALRESARANLLQAELLRNAPVIAAFHDRDYNIVWANRAYEEATGLSQNEIVGRKCYAVWRLAKPCRGCPVATAIDSGVASEAELTPQNQDHWPESQGYWLSRAAPVRDENGTVIGAIEMAFDIGDRKRAEEKLRASEALLSRSQEIAHTGSWKLDLTANRLTWSDEAYRIFGCRPQEFAATFEAFLDFVHPDDRAAVDEAYSHSLREGSDGSRSDGYEIEHRIVQRSSGEVRYVHERCVHERDDAGAIIQSNGMVQDITERKQSQYRDQFSRDLLELLNHQVTGADQIRSILQLVKDRTGVEAVGIRLQEGDDFPYLETNGFPDYFVQMERHLCAKDGDGKIVRDSEGNPVLECMCGNVLRCRTNPKLPFFTEGGSFWSNGTSELLASTTEEDRQARTRNRCNAEGYESVALIPLRTNDAIIGLLQLNDHQRNRFDLEMIQFFEGIGASIGVAFARKQTEMALRESEERFRITLESIGDAVISTDIEGRVALMNPVAEALTGWSTADARGLPLDEVFRIVNEQTRATVESPVGRVLREGQIVGLANHTLLIDRQGAERPIADSGAPIRDEQGQISGVVLVFRDQTEERRQEAALIAEHEKLRTSEAKYRILFTKSRDALMTLAPPSWRFTAGNPSACEMFGALDEQDFVSRPPWEYSPETQPDGRSSGDKAKDMIEAAMATGSHLFEWTHQRRGGGPFPATVLLTRVDVGGQTFLQATVRDDTAEKEALAERERLHASLAQSDRLASMGTLAAGVAHEINNPLSYVLYNVESAAEDLPRLADDVRRCHDALFRHLGPEEAARALGEQPDNGLPAAMEDVVDRLREAASGAHRIKDIARGLGTFSRVDRDEVTPVQLQPVIEQAMSMAFNQIKYRARVVKDYSAIPPVLAADGKLAQVFLNLFINAAHAIDEGHVEANEIRVRTWAEGDQVFAEVSDTGRGIAPENHDRIFQPFFTTKEVGVGSGLGLSIVRNIVTGFGGEISFSSEPGSGTRFLIRLPRLPREWQTGEASPPEDAPRRSTTRGRILVVDDEQAIRAIIVRMLGRDHEVVTAASGEEARAILEDDRRFDLVFCDLMMPRTSGMELHAWLTERDAELAAQVVFITGGAFTPGASDYLARVGNLRVEKPFDTVAFKKLTDELILAARAKLDRGS